MCHVYSVVIIVEHFIQRNYQLFVIILHTLKRPQLARAAKLKRIQNSKLSIFVHVAQALCAMVNN